MKKVTLSIREKYREMRKHMKKFLCVLVVITGSLIILHNVGLAQENFPTGPVTVTVCFSAGGGTDTLVRTAAEGAEKILGQKIVVLNKPGAGGQVAVSLCGKEKSDGYSLVACTLESLVVYPHMREVDYDPLQDFTYIIELGRMKHIFAVPADSPFKKWKDLVDWAKKHPGELSIGHLGVGTSTHLFWIKIMKQEGFTAKLVPFRGVANQITGLLGGHVMVGCASGAFQPHVEAGKLRVLLNAQRDVLSWAPEATSFEEAGYDFDFPSSWMIWGPAGIPDHASQLLQKAFIKGVHSEAFKKLQKIREFTVLEEPLTGEAFSDFVRENYFRTEQVLKEAGLYKTGKK